MEVTKSSSAEPAHILAEHCVWTWQTRMTKIASNEQCSIIHGFNSLAEIHTCASFSFPSPEIHIIKFSTTNSDRVLPSKLRSGSVNSSLTQIDRTVESTVLMLLSLLKNQVIVDYYCQPIILNSQQLLSQFLFCGIVNNIATALLKNKPTPDLQKAWEYKYWSAALKNLKPICII